MVDSAAHWVDHVIPHVPVRQWVLSLPVWLRYRVAYDSDLCTRVLGFFIHAAFRWYRHAAKRQLKLPSVKATQPGSVTCIQRFSSSYVEAPDGTVRFRALPPPTSADLLAVTKEVCRKVSETLGLDENNATEGDRLTDDEPLLAACAGASVQGRIATGERSGERVGRIRTLPPQPPPEKPDCNETAGFNLHAGVRVSAHDRKHLERVCRYILRPPISQERLGPMSDGRIGYRLKRPWRDGTTFVAFTPLEFIEKLVALVPPPRVHQTVFHGVLAPHARLRPQVTPKPKPTPPARADEEPACHASKRRRMDWATLLRRVYAIDILQCPRCGAEMRIIAAITQTHVIRAILKSCGLPSAPPERHLLAARPSQHEFDWSA
jgi:hypothetical protein